MRDPLQYGLIPTSEIIEMVKTKVLTKDFFLGDVKKIAKMLGDVQKTPEWETVRKRNAWVNIYNPGSKFDSFLKKQTKEMTKLMKKLGVI